MVFSLDVTHPPASASSSSPPPALCPPHILPPPNLSYLSLLTSFQMWIPALLESRVMPPVLGLFVSWYFLLSALLPCSHWLSCPCTHHLRLHLLPSSFPSLSCILVTKGDSILVSGIEKPKKKGGGGCSPGYLSATAVPEASAPLLHWSHAQPTVRSTIPFVLCEQGRQCCQVLSMQDRGFHS